MGQLLSANNNKIMSKNALLIFFLFPGALLIIAPLISFPYGFYIFLRIIVTATATYIIFDTYKNFKGINETVIIFSLVAILYNPIIPVYLTREIWLPINFVTAGIYFFNFYKINKKMRQ